MKGTAYLVQAALISLWWIGLLIDQPFYDAFQFPGIGSTAFNAFLLPDIIIIAILSVVRAYTKKAKLDYIILGGFAYATLYCINASILTNGGLLPTTVMTLGLCYNLFLINQNKLFRQSNTSNTAINGFKTTLQIICVWSITLIVFPTLIIESFEPNYALSNSYQYIGISILMLFSVFGIYSAYTMVINGAGTPLPMDQTQKLVTNGSYKYVRNPMAIAGIGQGIAISIMFTSIYVFIYSLIGAILWHFVVRPIEEKEMTTRFGKDYVQYKSNVKCWIPTFR